MHSLPRRLCVIACLVSLCGCAPSIKRIHYAAPTTEVADADCRLKIMKFADYPEDSAVVLGEIEVGDAGFSTDCLLCHNMVTWLGATFDHDSEYFPIYSGAHRGRWSSCATCHRIVSSDRAVGGEYLYIATIRPHA